MRKFKFIGDPKNYWGLLDKNRIYDEIYSANGELDTVCILQNENPSDWEEVFHKDTDLGYFAGLAMQSLLNRYESKSLYQERICADSVMIAKELIKQLDAESK